MDLSADVKTRSLLAGRLDNYLMYCVVSFAIVNAKLDIRELYKKFDQPIHDLDCGKKCAPYNGGIPFCCDTRHSVPTAYREEWTFLKQHTDLWHRWDPDEPGEYDRLAREAGESLVLIECLGAAHCQRNYRSLVCRAFPFFPYVDSRENFVGLSYYWEYEDRCWVISNLEVVSKSYQDECIQAYESIFEKKSEEYNNFKKHSENMRRVFEDENRMIPIAHRAGGWYLVDPQDESLTAVDPSSFKKYGPYEISDRLRFPDEKIERNDNFKSNS